MAKNLMRPNHHKVNIVKSHGASKTSFRQDKRGPEKNTRLERKERAAARRQEMSVFEYERMYW